MNLHCQRWRLDWILTSKHSVSEKKKEEKKRKNRNERNERERAQMGEIDFADIQTKERENDFFYFFRFV